MGGLEICHVFVDSIVFTIEGGGGGGEGEVLKKATTKKPSENLIRGMEVGGGT